MSDVVIRADEVDTASLGPPGEAIQLVAVDAQGEMVGSLVITRQQHRLRRHRAEIGGFVLKESVRGTGLARRLADAAADWAREQGCTILELTCRGGTHAEDAYRGLGFIEWARLPDGFVEPAGTFDQVSFYRSLPE